jgi:hypothetical protein
MISIEARCRDKSLQIYLANTLGYPMKEEDEPLPWMRHQGRQRPISQQGREAWEEQLVNISSKQSAQNSAMDAYFLHRLHINTPKLENVGNTS